MSTVAELKAELKKLNAEYAKIKDVPAEKRADFGKELNSKKQAIMQKIADAEAAAIYASAYNKDIEFYTFWKSMESYKQNLKDYPATYSTKMDYFKYLYGADGKR